MVAMAASVSVLRLESPPMRHWFAILLLLLVPLQFASAGVEAYCLQSSGLATSHGDHPPHACQMDEGDIGKEGRLHTDCAFCQVLAGAVLLDAGRLPLTGAGQVLVDTVQDSLASAPVAEPERPKWRRAA